MRYPERYLGYLFGSLVTASFASLVLFSRLASSTGFSIYDLLLIRFGVAAILLAPIFLSGQLYRLPLRTLLLLGLSGGACFATASYAGFFLVPAATGTVLLHGGLPLATIATAGLLGVTISHSNAIGYALLIAAQLILVSSAVLVSTDALLGCALVYFAALCWTYCTNLAKRLNIQPRDTAAIVAVVSFILIAPIYFFGDFRPGSNIKSIDFLIQLFVHGVVLGALTVFVYAQATRHLGPVRTALFAALVPPITTLVAIPMLGEVPPPSVASSVVLVAIGIGIVSMTPNTRPS